MIQNIAREREFSALSLLRFPFFLAVLLSNFSFKYFRHSLVLNWSKFPSSEDSRPAADEWKHQFQFIFQYQWNSARSMALVSMFPVQSVLRKSRPGFPARGHDSESKRPLFGCICNACSNNTLWEESVIIMHQVHVLSLEICGSISVLANFEPPLKCFSSVLVSSVRFPLPQK